MLNLVDRVPKPLYEDIVRGRWLPVVGAGLSRNARVPHGNPPPDWNGLAKELQAELSDPDETLDAVDVISAYSHEHGRPALVERVARAIRIADASPGPVHKSLCRLPVDVMITTNFDGLLEEAFHSVRKTCHAVLGEPQLAITNPFPGPTLLKIHGDISHPEKLVLTEDDFDHFLIRNPLLSTIVSSHFAQRSIVLIGYSLSDPDLRQLLAMIRERLGGGARAIYSIEVDPTPAKIARLARRHVRTVTLPGDSRNPAPTLEQLFRELFVTLGEDATQRLVPKTHEGGLALRGPAAARACFLSAPIDSQADYYEWLGPIASQLGAPLLSFQDFVAPGESILAAVDTMLAASGCAVVEYGSQWTSAELGMAINRLGGDRVFVVTVSDPALDIATSPNQVGRKPHSLEEWIELGERFRLWLSAILDLPPSANSQTESDILIGRVVRLAGELENALGKSLDNPQIDRSLGRMVLAAQQAGIISGADASLLREFVGLRNRVAHGQDRGLTHPQIESLLADVQGAIVQLSNPS